MHFFMLSYCLRHCEKMAKVIKLVRVRMFAKLLLDEAILSSIFFTTYCNNSDEEKSLNILNID